MNIDWSKAPEGATHYGATSYLDGVPDWCEAFYKSLGGRWLICFPASDDWHGDASKNRNWHERLATLIAHPATWKGEGLPPIGTVCEFMWDYRRQGSDYVKALAVHVDRGSLIVRVIEGEEKGSLRENKGGDCGGQPIFRPLRTPEQIAAEARHKAMVAMCIDAGSPELTPTQMETAGRLYDAGYRKTEALEK